VTAVGGTQIQDGWTWNPMSNTPFLADGSFNPDYWQWNTGGNQDVVWNEAFESIATGGGKSLIYPRPSWQGGVVPSAGDHRLVPDVAWNAAVNGGVLVYQSFFPNNERTGWHVYGGTSAASPQFGAFLALVNAKRATPIGFLNDKLYTGASGSLTDVGPVTEGTADVGHLWDNQLWDIGADGAAVKDPVAGFPTPGGYDMTTGWGVPNSSTYDALVGLP
jgi:subtilase family serine protease